jgi:hypothetical protein
MFTQLGPNSAQSSNGFKVERTGRDHLKYSEGDRFIVIDVEPGDGLAIYTSSISTWSGGSEAEPVKQPEIDRIIKNVCQALDFLQTPYVVEQ